MEAQAIPHSYGSTWCIEAPFAACSKSRVAMRKSRGSAAVGASGVLTTLISPRFPLAMSTGGSTSTHGRSSRCAACSNAFMMPPRCGAEDVRVSTTLPSARRVSSRGTTRTKHV